MENKRTLWACVLGPDFLANSVAWDWLYANPIGNEARIGRIRLDDLTTCLKDKT